MTTTVWVVMGASDLEDGVWLVATWLDRAAAEEHAERCNAAAEALEAAGKRGQPNAEDQTPGQNPGLGVEYWVESVPLRAPPRPVHIGISREEPYADGAMARIGARLMALSDEELD